MVNVYSTYKSWLRNYRRKNFDPFRRRIRITFSLPDGAVHETTVGQLNFIYWCTINGVIEYTRANMCAIETDMNANGGAAPPSDAEAEKKKGKQIDATVGETRKRKRMVLSSHPPNKCFVFMSENG